MASSLVSSSQDRAVQVLAREHCVVFLNKSLNSHSASLHGVMALDAGGNGLAFIE